MYFVRGVASIFGKGSGGLPGDSGPGSEGHGQNPSYQFLSWPEVRFSDDDDEGVLDNLWQAYQDASGQAETNVALGDFLKQFIQTYENWTPFDVTSPGLVSPGVKSPGFSKATAPFAIEEEGGSPASSPAHSVSSGTREIVGCAFGHPTKVIVGLIQELKHLIMLISDLMLMADMTNEAWLSPDDMEATVRLLKVLTIITRSSHNRRIFSFFSGMQALMGLMKAAVVKLKGVASIITADKDPPPSALSRMRFLECMIAQVLTTVGNYIETEPGRVETSLVDTKDSPSVGSEQGEAPGYQTGGRGLERQTSSGDIPVRRRHSGSGESPVERSSVNTVDNQGGVVGSLPLLETGGLNWFVELLRILKKLRLRGATADISLEQLTLKTLREAIFSNPKSQNHFRSIGGLEVLMTGLGILALNTPSSPGINSEQDTLNFTDDLNTFLVDFQMQVLSLQVLREAIFRNVVSLQALREYGAVEKFSKMIRFAAFTIPEMTSKLRGFSVASLVESPVFSPSSYMTQQDSLVERRASDLTLLHGRKEDSSGSDNPTRVEASLDVLEAGNITVDPSSGDDDLPGWNWRVADLCRILCSFLVPSGDVRSFASGMARSQDVPGLSGAYWELASRWIVNVLLGVFRDRKETSIEESEASQMLRPVSTTLQHYVLFVLKKMLETSPHVLHIFHEDGIWDVMFSKHFFYFGLALEDQVAVGGKKVADRKVVMEGVEEPVIQTDKVFDSVDTEPLRLEVISFVELAATAEGSNDNMPECGALLSALQRCSLMPSITTMLVKSLHRILQLNVDTTISSFKILDAVTIFASIMEWQKQRFEELCKEGSIKELDLIQVAHEEESSTLSSDRNEVGETQGGRWHVLADMEIWQQARENLFTLFTDFLTLCEEAVIEVTQKSRVVNALFNLLFEPRSRKFALDHILMLMKLPPKTDEDQNAKMALCLHYLETLPLAQVQCRGSEISLLISLLSGLREVLQTDLTYYQALFREGECFVHIVSLLNDEHSKETGLQLSLDVVLTLTQLLEGNEASKVAFRGLVGVGYKTLLSLLVERHQGSPSQGLLVALLDMLVDGDFSATSNMLIQNEDVILLFFNLLRKCDEQEQCKGLDTFYRLLEDSTANQASCVRSGLLSFLLDWFAVAQSDLLIIKLAQIVQMIGGHSISGKDMRRIFSLLRSTNDHPKPQHGTILLKVLQGMLKEEGPAVFFEMSGKDSGIVVTTPLRWPSNRGFSFSCWIRVQSYPPHKDEHVDDSLVGLFSFLSENGKGCTALLHENYLIFECNSNKRQTTTLDLKLQLRRWHFLCITHSTGRSLTGGNTIKIYLDGMLVIGEKFRYPRLLEPLIRCTIGASSRLPASDGSSGDEAEKFSAPFCGQLGPIYLFDDALSADQVLGIHSLGPSYMYSFLANDVGRVPENMISQNVIDSRDGLASKIVFGYNAQASAGRVLFDVSPTPEQVPDSTLYDALIMGGTHLCYRRLAQDSVHSVGGVAVFYPLLVQLDQLVIDSASLSELSRIERQAVDRISEKGVTIMKGAESEFSVGADIAVEVIELVTAVLSRNYANQQFMHNIAGLSVLGYLLQSVSPQHLTVNFVLAMERLLTTVVTSSSTFLSQALVKEALSKLYLNPHIWIFTPFSVQRTLYSSLLKHVETDATNLRSICGLARILDIVQQFYWDKCKKRKVLGAKPLVHPVTKTVIGERPSQQEVAKLRLLVLSVAEILMREHVRLSDIKALVAFVETSEDVDCLEDVLHMILGLLAHKQFVVKFVDHVFTLGGCHIFVNLLKRSQESIRLLALRIIGAALVAAPAEKKGFALFLGSGASKAASEHQRTEKLKLAHLFATIKERVLMFPFTDAMRATLFDMLLGGASPKQALQEGAGQVQGFSSWRSSERAASSAGSLALPQVLEIIMKFVLACEDLSLRLDILEDIVRLMEANSLNSEALVLQSTWQDWFFAVLVEAANRNGVSSTCDKLWMMGKEELLIRKIFCIVHTHFVLYVKGGSWHVERTVDFVHLYSKQNKLNKFYALHVILGDLFDTVLQSPHSQIWAQPCRDNILHLLTFVDELVMPDAFNLLAFSSDSLWEEADDSTLLSGGYVELGSNVPSAKSSTPSAEEAATATASHVLRRGVSYNHPKNSMRSSSVSGGAEITDKTHYWRLYNHIWSLLQILNGRRSGTSSFLFPASLGPSLGQRARGLVESINIPGAEMAAAVVSGGLGVVGITSNKGGDRSTKVKGEKYPRVVFPLTLLYLYEAELGEASRCVQQLLNLLPGYLNVESESNRNKLQLFLWSLLEARSEIGALDDGARFYVVSQLIRETMDLGKNMLASSLGNKDVIQDITPHPNESAVQSLLQRERITAAVREERKYIDSLSTQRQQEVDSLQKELSEVNSWEIQPGKSLEDQILGNLTLICLGDRTRRHAFQLLYDEEQQAISDHWCHLYRDMTDERGPWAVVPFPNNMPTRWKLDKTEDPSRRRFKTKRNYHFCEELLHPAIAPSQTQPVEAFDEDPQRDSDNAAINFIVGSVKTLLLKGLRGVSEEADSDDEEGNDGSSDEVEAETASAKSHDSEKLETTSNVDQVDATSKMAEEIALQQIQPLHTPDSGDQEVLLSVACVFVSPKRKLAGRLELMRSSIHFYGEFIVEGTGGSTVFTPAGGLSYPDLQSSDILEKGSSRSKSGLKKESIPGGGAGDMEKGNAMDRLEPVRNITPSGTSKDVKRHRRWDLFQVKGIQGTRFLLQYTALEIFFSHSIPPVFLNFPSQKHAKDVSTMIINLRSRGTATKPGSKEKDESLVLIDKRKAIDVAERARDRWRRREISNFDYLMTLNTVAGRSYNDLTQYPVFPWIVADYTSEKLDLANPATFRDLSKPVGALNEKRFQMFEERFRSFSDPDIPSFYYGSHYSSMGIVLFYLLRLEPFSTLHRHLQGGKFDHADRLFHSISGAYANCLTNTSDVKELVPEFFYMPEFLANTNQYFIGVKQDGEELGDVILPPWAKDAEEFVRKHREALESEYVSDHLNEWIDLIFGYKQRGKSALEAANVFYHLTYEGAVNLEAIESLNERAAVEDQIANFGQTPVQLFRKKHPKRGLPMPITRPLYYVPASISVTTSIPGAAAGLKSYPTVFVGLVDGKVVTISSNLTITVRAWITPALQGGGSFTFSSSQEPFYGIGSDSTLIRRIGGPMVDDVPVTPGCFGTLHFRSHNFLLTCGQWDNSFKVVSMSDGRMVQSNCHHKDVINCLSVAVDGSVVVTGSCDTTVMVWEVELAKTRRTTGGKDSSSSSSSSSNERSNRLDPVIISNKPRHVLCGHDDAVTCVVVRVELDLVVSGSKDSTCILHTLRLGRYVRSIQHPNKSPISKLLVSQQARLVMFSNEDLNLHLFSVNGKKLAVAETNGRVNCMELSSCGEFIVYGGDNGQIVVRSMYTLEVIRKYDGTTSPVTALVVTPEDCFLVGTQEGDLVVYSVVVQQQPARKSSAFLSALRRPSAAAF
ncbi:hypothetical protein MPTK1_1g22060 [Marchantia polymorpha subsp. ruderalis]|uniref:BEACH domain-containing protein n=2 Tax=Marchantia polymorpha TaxID=3197 RepID=A0AAF6ASZ3_MARPO|nr:hypothetical protein MARPO_0001s0542 [Marchantia polymorpha]BBM99563.1 hypothetical protein Mp_1g22060 [Marchantia polymorpha subsp. ruderalis]|eukprot:PTQ50648.1 hypothetical protein MARPO_0001s0542 [Marchantia polymorpha]